MSSTIEEIDTIQEMEELEEIEEHVEFDEIDTHVNTNTNTNRGEEAQKTELQNINDMIMDLLYKKVKEPFLVTLLMIVFTHPLLIKFIFNLPYMEVVEKTVSVNIMLAISTGIAFFILREFI
jgi:hypothetical protein